MVSCLQAANEEFEESLLSAWRSTGLSVEEDADASELGDLLRRVDDMADTKSRTPRGCSRTSEMTSASDKP